MDKLLELENDRRTIFIGDTHGDFDATRKIVESFPPDCERLIFLGDYVDRGEKSQENIDYLLGLRNRYPENVILLIGNHETWGLDGYGFSPAEWWESIKEDEGKVGYYINEFRKLPLAVSVSNIIALHGWIPSLDNIRDINDISYSMTSARFEDITWGRCDTKKKQLFADFVTRMEQIKKKILIRGHDTTLPTHSLDNKCMTLITTDYAWSARVLGRRVAILEKGAEPQKTTDLQVITV